MYLQRIKQNPLIFFFISYHIDCFSRFSSKTPLPTQSALHSQFCFLFLGGKKVSTSQQAIIPEAKCAWGSIWSLEHLHPGVCIHKLHFERNFSSRARLSQLGERGRKQQARTRARNLSPLPHTHSAQYPKQIKHTTHLSNVLADRRRRGVIPAACWARNISQVNCILLMVLPIKHINRVRSSSGQKASGIKFITPVRFWCMKKVKILLVRAFKGSDVTPASCYLQDGQLLHAHVTNTPLSRTVVDIFLKSCAADKNVLTINQILKRQLYWIK